MANIIKRTLSSGKISYQVRWRTSGAKELSRSFKTEEEAINFNNDLNNIKNNKNAIPRFPLSLWLDRYESEELKTKSVHMQTSEKRIIQFWRQMLGKEIAIDLSPLSIEEVANQLYNRTNKKGTNLSPSTRRNYIICLNFIFEISLKKWKWCSFNPVLGVDRHEEKISLNKTIVKEKQAKFFNCEFKKEFSEICKEKMKTIKLKNIMKATGYSKSSIQGLLDPNHNSCIFQMFHLASILGLKIEIYHV